MTVRSAHRIQGFTFLTAIHYDIQISGFPQSGFPQKKPLKHQAVSGFMKYSPAGIPETIC
jgi:hypothetical protein